MKSGTFVKYIIAEKNTLNFAWTFPKPIINYIDSAPVHPFCMLTNLLLMPYPFIHFYFDIKFGNRLFSKEERPGSPLSFEYNMS